MKMTADEFERRLGRRPEQDDLQRVNCRHAGMSGHAQCGWCDYHNVPFFMCGCAVFTMVSKPDFRPQPKEEHDHGRPLGIVCLCDWQSYMVGNGCEKCRDPMWRAGAQWAARLIFPRTPAGDK